VSVFHDNLTLTRREGDSIHVAQVRRLEVCLTVQRLFTV